MKRHYVERGVERASPSDLARRRRTAETSGLRGLLLAACAVILCCCPSSPGGTALGGDAPADAPDSPEPSVDATPVENNAAKKDNRQEAEDGDEAAIPRLGALFDGKTLTGWHVPDSDMFSDHGAVRIVDESIVMAVGTPATGIRLKGSPLRIDYEIRLQAKRTDGSDFFCGLTFPIADQYCSLIVGGWGGTVVGLSNVDSKPADENATTTFLTFEKNRWYRIRLRVTADQIDVWIDDDHTISLPTEGHEFDIWWEQEPMRPLGIASWSTGSALRGIRVQQLKGSESGAGDRNDK